jgi:Cu-Zn family superoxide dismutase
MNRFTRYAAPLMICAILAIGCKSKDKNGTSSAQKMGPTAVAVLRPAGAAATMPANKNATGTVTFTEVSGGVRVVANVSGLSPGSHGFHIHEAGNLSDPALKGAGAHYNPNHTRHGGPDSSVHHVGDLGNIVADAEGNAHLESMIPNLKLTDIVGRSVIVHAGQDDLKPDDPSGHSGARVAGGVIQMQK